MASGSKPSWENLCWHNKCGCIRPKVCEEKGERVNDHKSNSVLLKGPVVIGNCKSKHEDSHKEEPHQLNGKSSYDINEGHSEPISRNCTAESNEGLSPCNSENLLKRIHGLCWRNPTNCAEYILLEQILAVECNVKQEPCACSSKQMKSVAIRKFLGEQSI
ncbi:hypothetical protein V8G54_028174 [Vigna mungo]|uniref:Uncharacterized protein n=1 Tax=Vigna mungo TaxID=3915 RepID=A0AAQ3MSA2_VIGMU